MDHTSEACGGARSKQLSDTDAARRKPVLMSELTVGYGPSVLSLSRLGFDHILAVVGFNIDNPEDDFVQSGGGNRHRSAPARK